MMRDYPDFYDNQECTDEAVESLLSDYLRDDKTQFKTKAEFTGEYIFAEINKIIALSLNAKSVKEIIDEKWADYCKDSAQEAVRTGSAFEGMREPDWNEDMRGGRGFYYHRNERL